MSNIAHEDMEEIVCPYCGYTMGDSWELEPDSDTYDCEECGKTFNYERTTIIYYSTWESEK